MTKPTGVRGYYRVQTDETGNVCGSFRQIPFSGEKADVEKHIVANFLTSVSKKLPDGEGDFLFWNPRQNKEDDFDFTVDSPRGPAYLELMEARPFAGRYEHAPVSYKPYDYAATIYDDIKRKSERYPKNMAKDLFLLVYVTHWTFELSDLTALCLSYWIRNEPHAFRAILSFEPYDVDEGEPGFIYPYPPEVLDKFDPECVRDTEYFLPDIRKGYVLSEGKS